MPVSNLTIDSFRVAFTANGKRQIQIENISKLKKKKKAGKNSSKQFLWIKLALYNSLFCRSNEQ